MALISQNPIQLSNTERIQFNKLKRNQTEETAQKQMIDWELKTPTSRSTIGDIVEHVDYIKTITGNCDHVGIGYGFENPSHPFVVSGATSSANHMSIVAALLEKGYSDDCVKNIMGLNFMRVMAKVESVAKTITSS